MSWEQSSVLTWEPLTPGKLHTTFTYINSIRMYVRGFAKFQIKVACGLKFHWYLRALSLKFQKARTKIEGFLSLPWIG